MKTLNVLAGAVILAVSGTAVAQSYSAWPGRPAIYDPNSGPLPPERRFVMTREGAEEALYNAQKPASAALQPAAAPAPVVATAPVAVPARRTYALPERAARPTGQAPDWFVRLPEDTEEMMFAAGTATSTDEQMAYDKARMHAERKLVEIMSARITTQTRSYRADSGGAMTENFQQVTRKNARGELIGAQRVDSQASYDGQTYKVYVLLRLPLGTANVMQTQQIQARQAREAEIRAQAAERDMDAQETQEQRRRQEAETQLRQQLTPRSESTAPAQSTVTPVVVPGANGAEVKLLDVDNEEYKRRRELALQKPGAVVGHITVR